MTNTTSKNKIAHMPIPLPAILLALLIVTKASSAKFSTSKKDAFTVEDIYEKKKEYISK